MSDSHTAYERDGFYLAPAVIPPPLLGRAKARVEAVWRGEYETGIAPSHRNLPPSAEPPRQLVKIDSAHWCDRTLHDLVSHPAIGRLAATLTGARLVQVFATQLLIKPPSREETVNVGWHQDLEYWHNHLEGELLTAWVAISEVPAEAGPVRFVRGSHRWGLLQAGDFFSGDLAALRERIQQKHGEAVWEEVSGVLPSGGVSFHHCLTVHGSGPNLATHPRVSMAIHLRTDRAALRPGVGLGSVPWLRDFNDPLSCPVAYTADPRELQRAETHPENEQ